MGPIRARTVIDAPRRQVYDLLLDVANRPAFLDHFMDSWSLLDVRTSGVGAGLRARVPVPFRELWLETVIERVEPPHLIDERGLTGRGGRMPARTVFELVESGEGMTEATVTFWTEPGFWWDRVRDATAVGQGLWWARNWRRGLVRLGSLAESGARPEPRLRVAGLSALPVGVP